jgi:hypothetical protein
MIIQLREEFKVWRELVVWLTEHCGPVLNNKPVLYWKGREWELIYGSSGCWQITINDPHVSSLFLLRWS